MKKASVASARGINAMKNELDRLVMREHSREVVMREHSHTVAFFGLYVPSCPGSSVGCSRPSRP